MMRGLGRPKSVPQMNATPAAKGGRKVHKTKPKPHITLADGDEGVPLAELAKEHGVTERTFKRMNVPLVRIGGCLYGSRQKTREVLTAQFNNPTKRARRSRR
jgi:hypothetical protein